MNLRTPRRITSLAVLSTAATLAFALAGCTSPTSGGDAPAAPAEAAPSSAAPAPAATPDTGDSLKALVLTTSEIPVGGWTADGDLPTGSDGTETSQDATGPGACGLVLDAYFDTSQPNAAQTWSRAATSSTLISGIQVDPKAGQHIESLANALAACPPSSRSVQNGSPTTVNLSVKDLGGFGDARTCFTGNVFSNASGFSATECLVAVGSRIVVTSVKATYASQLPSDDEVAKIMAAAVAKVVAAG
jgi:tetrahydromethanopterin S-methyltransferase subunit D